MDAIKGRGDGLSPGSAREAVSHSKLKTLGSPDRADVPTSFAGSQTALEGGHLGTAQAEGLLPADTPLPSVLSPPKGHGETVLVVDDDASVRKSTSMLLRTLGYKAIEAESGLSAMAVLRADAQVAIVVSDVVMPQGVSGFDLARWIRTERPAIKIMLVSGQYSTAHIENLSLDVPMLSKPYQSHDLAREIHRLLALD